MSQEGQGLEPERLTWAVLLARWTDFARSAVALPQDGEAGMVRQSVTDIITLQAVWFALGHLDDLEGPERALGLDRSGVLISRHSAAIRTLSLRFGTLKAALDRHLESIAKSQAIVLTQSLWMRLFRWRGPATFR